VGIVTVRTHLVRSHSASISDMTRWYRVFVGLAAASLLTYPLEAQHRIPREPIRAARLAEISHFRPAIIRADGSGSRPVIQVAAAGLAAGALGAWAGWHLASGVADQTVGPLGLVLGESLFIPAGVHVADGRRGNLAFGMLASLGAGAIAALAATALERRIDPEVGYLVLAPVLQVGASILVERSTGR
jgi:hypothetical protein